MADHLPLPEPRTLNDSKRALPNPVDDENAPPFDNRGHASSLRGILEGLERGARGLFGLEVQPVGDEEADEVEEVDAEDLGRIVLKITGTSPFQSGGLGGWDNKKMLGLGFSDNNAYYALTDADSRAFFRELVERYDADPDGVERVPAWRDALKNITNVTLYDRADRLSPGLLPMDADAVQTVDISIWPTSVATRGAEKVARERVQEIVDLITASTDDRVVVLIDDASSTDLPFVRAVVDAETLDELLEHPFIERIRGPLAAEFSTADLQDAARPASVPAPEGAPIGIIDDLVDSSNPWMHGVVVARRDFPDDGSLGIPTTHGTQVASIAAWGRVADLLDGTTDRAPRPIYSARVAHRNADGLPQIAGGAIENVSAAMRWLADEGVRIVVFAFAHSYPDSGALPSELTAVVDGLARELGLVVIVSAGNLLELPDGKHWKHDYPAYLAEPYARIAAPGNAALALTVGSVAHTEAIDEARFPSGKHIADAGKPAPFSRTGPTPAGGAAGRQKPEFTGHGGSWGWDYGTESTIRRDASLGTVTLNPTHGSRLFSIASGTSFAAPQVANEVAKIATRYPDAGPNLLRALTALAGEQPNNVEHVQHGLYGIPRAERILESQGSRAILVHEGTITGNTYQVIELPIPDEFAQEGRWDREFRVALAFDPGVRRSRRHYIHGHIEFSFVRNKTMAQIEEIYRKQPTVKQRKSGADYFELPRGHDRPPMLPGSQSVLSDTVMARSYRTLGTSWSEADSNYFLVLDHKYSPWAPNQKDEYPTQEYAVAVELVAHGRPELDVHGLTEARLAARPRVRLR